MGFKLDADGSKSGTLSSFRSNTIVPKRKFILGTACQQFSTNVYNDLQCNRDVKVYVHTTTGVLN